MDAKLKLRAEDAEDLKVVSAFLQDAIVPVGEMCFLPEEHRFVMVVNRFRWEDALDRREVEGPDEDARFEAPYERTNAGVRVSGVTRVAYRGFDLKDRGRMLALLGVVPEDGALLLHFAEGACIRLEVRDWVCHVEDIGEPWPTSRMPSHPLDEGVAGTGSEAG